MSSSSEAQNPEHTTDINIPYSGGADQSLRITAGACRMRIAPDAGPAWVTGTYTDPSGYAPLRITSDMSTVRLVAGDSPAVALGLLSGVPVFELRLGTAQPYALTVETGGSDCRLDLTGLPLIRLEVKQGAGRLDIDFGAPNPVAMSLLHTSTGAGGFDVRHLANANATEMIFDGGAAAYTLDFSGKLQRDTHARVATGVSSVELRVPSSTAARVSSESLLCPVEPGEGWSKNEVAYWNEAGRAGNRPLLRIACSVALGSLRLSPVRESRSSDRPM